jgi:hypothetical protein
MGNFGYSLFDLVFELLFGTEQRHAENDSAGGCEFGNGGVTTSVGEAKTLMGRLDLDRQGLAGAGVEGFAGAVAEDSAGLGALEVSLEVLAVAELDSPVEAGLAEP